MSELSLPKIKRETDRVISENTTIKLTRSDALVNSLSVQSFSWFNQPVAFSWGFVTASATSDTIQLLTGLVGGLDITGDTIEVGVVDKNDAFSKISVGSKDNPVGSHCYLADMWWTC